MDRDPSVNDSRPDAEDTDEVAAGSVENPIPPGEPQPGDANEMASLHGGPVDVAPGHKRKPSQQGE
ncbi:hypothetical protein [Roseomonas haemaphysalidis]|uniref:MatE family transporter n=1 Tax=Roseomonas haemaphysalidis TaxID=2768162 RepID=A0ABS3KPL8_9PROT|nr:hypothetical protein [Roseomonas haemaphysalidis]MBO1079404.1 hypothetical protein [Roseomonas haemaphysalidis]